MDFAFKQIPGFYQYEINKIGVVRKIKTGQIIKPFDNGIGYSTIRLLKSVGDRRNMYVHRLVYQTFVGTIDEDKEINHIDHDKSNNQLSNLEMISHRRNVRKSLEFRGIKKAKQYCEDCGAIIYRTSMRCTKCCAKMARKVKERPGKQELRKLIHSYSFLELGRMFGVSDNAIRKWCKSYGLPHRKKEIKQLTN